jgi:hypothetical protein
MSKDDNKNLPTGEVDITGFEDSVTMDPDQDAMFDINSFGEHIKWDDLAELRNDTAKQLASNMILLEELYKQNSDIVKDGSELSEMITGLMSAYSDIGNELMKVTAMHSDSIDPKTNIPMFKTGKVVGTDDQMTHLSISSQYVTLLQQIGNLAAVGYLDIVTAISTVKPNIFSKEDVEGMKTSINTLTDEVNNTIKESMKNV